MKKIIKNPAQILTINSDGQGFKRGTHLEDIGLLENHSIIIENEVIKDFIPNSRINKHKADEIIDADGKVAMPGLIDCHTHTAFAGSRANEFRQKLKGICYEEIAKKGGGINTTVDAVRKSSFDELVKIVKPRIDNYISQGVTTLEIKSGYGLSFYDEVKLLQVIKHLNSITEIDIVPTFLGAHTYPREYKNDHSSYIDIIIKEMIPYVANHKLAVFCDGFCEKGSFTAKEIDLIFTKAVEHGLKLKLHTEQFNNIGGLQVALKHTALTVDHLEVIKEDDIPLLAESNTIAVLLPGVSFFLDYEYAPARKLIESEAIVALATDFNPGSSHISNMSLIMSLASIKMKMSMEETLSAITLNAAAALDLGNTCGSLEINKAADFAIFEVEDYSEIVYSAAHNLNCMTIKKGEVIYNKNRE